MRNSAYIRKRLALLLALVLLTLTGCSGPEAEYRQAQELLSRNEFSAAAEKFAALGGYEDAGRLTAYSRACARGEEGDYAVAVAALKVLGDYKDSVMRAVYYDGRRLEVQGGTEDWEFMLEAKALYESIPLFLDCAERIPALEARVESARKTQYDAAVAAGEAGQFDAADSGFKRLGDYMDSENRAAYYDVRRAEAALVESDDQYAMRDTAIRYKAMGEYLDCAARAESLDSLAEETQNAKLARAVQLAEAGQCAEAEALLDTFNRGGVSIPVLQEHYVLVANQYTAYGCWDEAVSLFTKLEMPRGVEMVGYKRAEDLMAKGRWDEASALFEETTYKDAFLRILEPYYHKGKALMAEGRWAEAVEPLYRSMNRRLVSVSNAAPAADESTAASSTADGHTVLTIVMPPNATFRKELRAYESDALTCIKYCVFRAREENAAETKDADLLAGLARYYAGLGDFMDSPDRAAALTGCADASVAERLSEIDGLLESGDLDGAMSRLKQFGAYGGSNLPERFYTLGGKLVSAARYEEAVEAYAKAGDYRDAQTCLKDTTLLLGGQYASESKWTKAYETYASLGSYKDSAEKAREAYARSAAAIFGEAKVGGYVKFGSYEQDKKTENGKEEIEWLVLAKDKKRMLLISRYALDRKPYHTQKTGITWENSSLRAWLNSDFLNEAFTDEQQMVIAQTEIPADKNPDYVTPPGSSTTDKVFLLSAAEAKKYFSNNEKRSATVTAYAKPKGDGTRIDWWLRTPGADQQAAAVVVSLGRLDTKGEVVTINSDVAVRPAIWVSLD